VQAVRQKIRQVFQAALGRSQAALLRQLNPLLRGWANYYRNGAANGTIMSGRKYGAGLTDATPTNPWPGRRLNTSPQRGTKGALASATIPKRARAACSASTGWPAPPSNVTSKSGGPPTPTTHATLNTSPSAGALPGPYAGRAITPQWVRPVQPKGRALRSSFVPPPRAHTERTGCKGLSRMKGNFHVRFLGGRGRATARAYPAVPAGPWRNGRAEEDTFPTHGRERR
jgi:hypothetical protein